MRRFFGVAVLTLGMLMGARGAAAQLIDPSTGVMVDAGSDPMDFSAVASGQPGNIGMELSAQASEQAQAMAQQSMADMQATAEQAAADSQASMASFMSSTNSNDDVPVAQAPALPATPKPVITPGGGTFKGSVQVTIADSDSVAAVFYTTNGKKPTTSSERYDGPIAVSAKTKVQALAFDVNMQPSGVVTKTFKVKAAKGSSLPEGAS